MSHLSNATPAADRPAPLPWNHLFPSPFPDPKAMSLSNAHSTNSPMLFTISEVGVGGCPGEGADCRRASLTASMEIALKRGEGCTVRKNVALFFLALLLRFALLSMLGGHEVFVI